MPAPTDILSAVADGFFDEDTWLRSAVMVKVPLRRRDRRGWPAAIISGLICGPEVGEGILAVWAVSRVAEPVASLNGAAYEFSRWPLPRSAYPDASLTFEIMAGYPEVMAAQQGVMRLDGGHAQRL